LQKSILDHEVVILPRMRLQLLAGGDQREPPENAHPTSEPRTESRTAAFGCLVGAGLCVAGFTTGVLEPPGFVIVVLGIIIYVSARFAFDEAKGAVEAFQNQLLIVEGTDV